MKTVEDILFALGMIILLIIVSACFIVATLVMANAQP